jgi:hypothetical protein
VKLGLSDEVKSTGGGSFDKEVLRRTSGIERGIT